MKILYAQAEYETGKHRIYYVVPNHEWFYFNHTTNIPLDEMTVDEVNPNNKAIGQDLIKYGIYTKADATGENKYHIKIESGEPVIYEKEGWEEAVDEL